MLETKNLLKIEFQKDETHKVFGNATPTYWSLKYRKDVFATRGNTNQAARSQIYELIIRSSLRMFKTNSLASSPTKKTRTKELEF